MRVLGEEEQKTSGRTWLCGVLVVGLVLRLTNAWFASFHLDDFHSLYHARAADLSTFFEGLLRDNHPPLSFLALRIVRVVLGEGELALRIPGLLYAVGTLLLVWRMSRRLPNTTGRVAALAVVALSSLQIETSTDLRMYGLLTLAMAGLLDALVDLLEDDRGAWRVVLWTVVGLHTHYHFLHAIFVLASTLVLMLALSTDYRARVSKLGAVALAVLVLSLPWYALGFPRQLAHDLSPGGVGVSNTLLAEGMLHLTFLNLSLGGEFGRPIFLAAGGALLALGLGAGLWLVRPAPTRWRTAAGPLWFAGAWLLPTWTALAAALFARAGFEWRYLVGALPPLALLVGYSLGDGAFGRTRRWIVGLALLAAFWLATLNALDPGRENYRGAVARTLELAGPGDAVLPAEWSPQLFPHGLAWEYYAPRLAPPDELPERLEHTDEFDLILGTDLSPYERVVAVLRSIPEGTVMIERLRAEYPREQTEAPGAAIFVITFDRQSER